MPPNIFAIAKINFIASHNSVYLVTALTEPLPILLPTVATSDIRKR